MKKIYIKFISAMMAIALDFNILRHFKMTWNFVPSNQKAWYIRNLANVFILYYFLNFFALAQK